MSVRRHLDERVPPAPWHLAALAVAALAFPGVALSDETPRTSWGAPDLQGTWDFRSITPFERPKEFGDKEFLSAEEIAAWEARTLKAREDRRNRDPVLGQGDVDVGYNAFWLDRGEKMTGTLRTSLVVDPPDGRVPALKETARRRSAERYARWGGVPAGPEDRNPLERCIMGFNSGPPMNPGAYNNFVEIFQTPTHVALLNEMINDHRVVPLDGRDHVPENVRLWKGDSRGRWEGDTLVVTTRNFTEHTNFRGSGPNMVLVERFTRNSEDTLRYEYTVDDLESFEKPWSVAVEMKKTSDPLLEYACHEGNRAMFLMLRGARAQEQKGKTTDDWLATWYGGSKAVKEAEKRLKEAEDSE
ncbi:MAG: hypothetical protein OXN97_04640 [Bryobacterales bacterium]|nr:hypothetical protein [Bryobacterales bacterium]